MNIKADPFFAFDKEFVYVDVLIDHVNWVQFFRRVETDFKKR